jgi:hypothetical protein
LPGVKISYISQPCKPIMVGVHFKLLLSSYGSLFSVVF